MKAFKNIIVLTLILFLSISIYAQTVGQPNVTIKGISTTEKDSSKFILINNIDITGFKKTKNYIIHRELQFKKGDSIKISNLQKELEQARQQIYNTTLFNEVQISFDAISETHGIITIQLKERWYLYPVPVLRPVDRNFNEWIKTYNASLDRLNYGIKFVHYNLSGQRDQLRIYLVNGYTRTVSFSYTNPYSSKNLNEGFIIGAGYAQNREMAYKTDSANGILQYRKDNFTKNNVFINAGYTIRKGMFKKHIIQAKYNYVKVDDSILHVKYNPHYFNENTNNKAIFDLSYEFKYSNLNNSSYPLFGKSYFINITKRGFGLTGGLNMLSLELGYNKYFSLGNNWYSSILLNSKIKLPFKQAYINQSGLGYGETYLRGLEFYVIDGVLTGLSKTTIKKKLVSFKVPFNWFPKVITHIPFTIFAKAYSDIGYAYNQPTYYSRLNNRLLYTGGFGIDILTLYDLNIRFEYSFNQLRENGLFLHNQSGF